MAIYKSAALHKLTWMVRGRNPLDDNDLWHWIKHARPRLGTGCPFSAEIPGIETLEAYLEFAQSICKAASNGAQGTEVLYRHGVSTNSSTTANSFVIWYRPDPTIPGLFLAVKDCHDHGELITMFPPDDGYAYFEAEKRRGGVYIQ